MTTTLDPIIASARIVTPEQAARDQCDLALMKISLGVARLAGAPLHVVQFSDGVAAMVYGDPNDTEAWQKALAQVHQAANIGLRGPISLKE